MSEDRSINLLARMCFCLSFLLFVFQCQAVAHAQIKVAVASNFFIPAQRIVESYANLGHEKPIILSGSTGKHTAQILHGLDVDVLLAADSERPMLLEKQGRIIPGSRVSYALGRLSVLSNVTDGQFNCDYWDQSQFTQLLNNSNNIAIANPKIAPYGAAANYLIEALSLDETVPSRIVMGENVAQAFHFFQTGNADTAIVAQSLVVTSSLPIGCQVPVNLHPPIIQQMVLLSKSAAAKKFYDFILSDAGLAIITQHGYDSPND